MRIARLDSASLEIVHERIDVGAAHIGVVVPVPRRVEQAALGGQRIVAASGDALPHPIDASAAKAPAGAIVNVRHRSASVDLRSGAVSRHERDVQDDLQLSLDGGRSLRGLFESRVRRRNGAGLLPEHVASRSDLVSQPIGLPLRLFPLSSCARQRFGRHVRVCLELEQTQIVLGKRLLRLLQTLAGVGEMSIKLADVRVFLGDGLLEAHDRGVQLTDVSVGLVDLAHGVLCVVPSRQPRMPMTISRTSRCASVGSEALAASMTRAADAVCAGDVKRRRSGDSGRAQARQGGSRVDGCREATLRLVVAQIVRVDEVEPIEASHSSSGALSATSADPGSLNHDTTWAACGSPCSRCSTRKSTSRPDTACAHVENCRSASAFSGRVRATPVLRRSN